MADKKYLFGENATKRVVAAVRKSEREPPSPPDLYSSEPGGQPQRFLARLKALGTGDNVGKWKWEAIYIKRDGEYDPLGPTSDDLFTAKEYNSKAAVPGDVVWLEFFGFQEGDDAIPIYRFHIGGGGGGVWMVCTAAGSDTCKAYVLGVGVHSDPATWQDVKLTYHTVVGDSFVAVVIPNGPAIGFPGYFQVGLPPNRGVGAVLQIMAGGGGGNERDWDKIKGT